VQPVPGIRLHRVRLLRLDRTTYDGLPITDRARTVVDLLRTERFGRSVDLLDRAIQQGWIDEFGLAHAIKAEPGRTGNVQLRILLTGIEPGAHAESERILHRILRRGGLTSWIPQYEIVIPGGTAYADVAFPEQRIVIEVDGRNHDDRFESDRERQNKLMALGWRVLRFTWKRLTQDSDGVLDEIVQLLAA